MTQQNLFEELQAKKRQLADMADKATDYGWISDERRDEIKAKLEKDVLTIGVIGQMKCGKSTFLNAFVFEDDVLPAATVPMTAALSFITYGERKMIKAEFYTEDEWEELKLTSERSLDDVRGNALEESKVNAAKELVKKASKSLGSSLDSYLGKTQEDEFANLIDYVGADGKYVSITKSVTIYYPKEYLKGVEIVDTPGFNDPIVSREERTKDFLRRADVVLMMLFAGRPFDATDKAILMQNVRRCGIGKVIIGINKYDIPYKSGESEEGIKEYVKEQIRKACKECDDNTLTELLKQAEPITLSTGMALLSELPMNRITSNEEYIHLWDCICKDFEISSQSQMREKSHLDILVAAVKQMVETEKAQILFAKPLNAIMAAGGTKKAEIEQALFKSKNLITDLGKPDDELEEKKEKLERAERRLNKKIDGLGFDLDESIRQIIRRGGNELEDKVDASVKKMKQIIEGAGRFSNFNSEDNRVNEELATLVTRTLKRAVERISEEAKGKVKNVVRDFVSEADEICMRYIPDFEGEDFVKSMNNSIRIEIDNDLFRMGEGSEDETTWIDNLAKMGWEFMRGATLGGADLFGKLIMGFVHDDAKQERLNFVDSLRNDFDPQNYLESIISKKEDIMAKVKELAITELIEPMKVQIDEILSNKASKEEQLSKAKEEEAQWHTKKSEIERQLAEMEHLKI